jgi:hypothetical protein
VDVNGSNGPLVTDAAPCKFLHEGRRPVEIAAETGRWLQFALRSAVRTKYEFYVVAIRAAFLVVRIYAWVMLRKTPTHKKQALISLFNQPVQLNRQRPQK